MHHYPDAYGPKNCVIVAIKILVPGDLKKKHRTMFYLPQVQFSQVHMK